MAREEAISLLLGYASIASWLGAQFPQIIVNWRLKSVEGLALPFLANWLLGDTTNLIGCLLTDQLPFQTYLATYFVFVDICLVSQFLYYYTHPHTKTRSILTSPSARRSRSSVTPHSPGAHAFSRTRISRSHSASRLLDPHLRAAVASMTPMPSELDSRHQDSLPSEVDVHSFQPRLRSRGSRRGSMEGLPENLAADGCEPGWGGRRFTSLERDVGEEAADAESESTPSIMIDSFHSEGGGRGRGRGKHVSWTRESPVRDSGTQRSPLLDYESSNSAPLTARGRQLTRLDIHDSPITTEAPVSEPRTPRIRRMSAASAVSAAASRRSASIVFLGIFALFSFSSYPVIRRSTGSDGRVLSMRPTSAALIPDDVSSSLFTHPTASSLVAAPDTAVKLQDLETHLSASDDNQRFLGRVSAWTCTTLYLTSRLPQIWKNFVRKSVAGLSMYLFISAFMGNFFYVLSIITSPKMDLPTPLARQFIRDSIPYILGSGGTLLFDVTIVLQSFVYDPGRRGTRNRARRRNLAAVSEDERGALLATDPGLEEA